MWLSGEKVFAARETASTKALRQECLVCTEEPAGRPLWLVKSQQVVGGYVRVLGNQNTEGLIGGERDF